MKRLIFFDRSKETDVAKKIQPLSDVGLGYVKLGQISRYTYPVVKHNV